MILSAFTLRVIVMVGGLKKPGHAVESLGSLAGIGGVCGGRSSLIFAVNGGNAQTLFFSGTSLNVDVSAFSSLSRTMRLDM